MANQVEDPSPETTPAPIFVVSGGVGASGEQVVHTVLAQFPGARVPVITVGNVRQIEQVLSVVAQAKSRGGMIAHTMVDAQIRQALTDLAEEHGVVAIDLMGPLLDHLSVVLGRQPEGHPGLYRQLHREYYDRVSAIEYTMAHDDGKDPPGWAQAEIFLTGVSRTGKTPLSLYLSVLGWKVANLPLVEGVQPPRELFALNQRRVVGLTIEPGQLLLHRQQRQARLGAPGSSPYVDPAKVYEEVQAALRLFRKNSFTVVDVTDKPIESIADEVIRHIVRVLPESHQHSVHN